MPFLLLSFWRLSAETNAGNWNRVVSLLEEVHARGPDSDDTHHRLGCAYVMLEKWEEAVREFEAIKEALPQTREDTRRYFNYALALAMVGRKNESLGVLESSGVERWRPDLREKGDQLFRYLREGGAPPPGVH